jgi:hypothetical protein
MVPDRFQDANAILKLSGGSEYAYHCAILVECSHGANTIVELKKHCNYYYVATWNLKIKGYRIGIYRNRDRFKFMYHTGGRTKRPQPVGALRLGFRRPSERPLPDE